MTDVWVFQQGFFSLFFSFFFFPPPRSSPGADDGNLSVPFEPPEYGGHLRIVSPRDGTLGYDHSATLPPCAAHARRANGGTWDRGGQNAYSSPSPSTPSGDRRLRILLEAKSVAASGRR